MIQRYPLPDEDGIRTFSGPTPADDSPLTTAELNALVDEALAVSRRFDADRLRPEGSAESDPGQVRRPGMYPSRSRGSEIVVHYFTVTSPCWNCGEPQTKQVYSVRDATGPFVWGCRVCEVDWVGPGEVVQSITASGGTE